MNLHHFAVVVAGKGKKEQASRGERLPNCRSWRKETEGIF